MDKGRDHRATILNGARIFHELTLELGLCQRSLPLAPVETPFLTLSQTCSGVGRIDPPIFELSEGITVSCFQKRVCGGRAATFILAPSADVRIVTTALSVLVSLAVVEVIAQSPEAAAGIPDQPCSLQLLPVSYESSVIHGGLLVTVPVPESAPDGSRIVMLRASVAGRDVALGECPLEVVVGFNHAPAQAGPVFDAVHEYDIPALVRVLEGGASTEEKDDVRVRRLMPSRVIRQLLLSSTQRLTPECCRKAALRSLG
jgi:hypothetical protein